MGEQFPHAPEDVTTDWLSEKTGSTITGFACEQIGVGVGLLGRLYRLTLDGDGPATVIAKFPTLDEGARMNVVSPLGFYQHEVAFYKHAADDTPVGTPKVYCADFDSESGDFALLLEDMGDRRVSDQIEGCSVGDAEAAIDTMAALHAHWWDYDFATIPWLASYSEPPYPQVIAGMFKNAWPRALEIAGDHIPPTYKEYGERFPDIVQWFMDELNHKPHTLCHGDFRLDNLFFATEPGHERVACVDWQISFHGRSGYDLGYFISQSLATDVRRTCEQALIDRYRNALAGKGIDYPDDELQRDYTRTVLYCFIYPVVAGGQIEMNNERQRDLVVGMLDRAITAIEDTDGLALLP